MNKLIVYRGNTLNLQKAYIDPKYGHKNVIADSKWQYVSMKLKRQNDGNGRGALFYWQQAEEFYNATKILPILSKPLTAYYSILNASKAMLISKGVSENSLSSHGVTGYQNGNSIVLANEYIKFNKGGSTCRIQEIFG